MIEKIALIETNVSLAGSISIQRYAEEVEKFISKHPPRAAS